MRRSPVNIAILVDLLVFFMVAFVFNLQLLTRLQPE